jgi:hypothetical protein
MRLPKLHPDANPTLAMAALSDAAREAGNVLGRGFLPADLPGEYLRWAAEQERMLTGVLNADEVARLLLTPRYWAVNSGPAVAGGPALAALSLQVQNELVGRQADLEAAGEAIKSEAAEWTYTYNGPNFPAHRRHAVVLDTCVLEMLANVLAAYQWSDRAGLSEGALVLVIPSVVRDELDGHKLSNNKPRINGEQVEQRKQARDALRVIDALFPNGDSWAQLDTEGPHPVSVFLPVDELTRHRMPSPDNEIVTDALELKPYAESVTLASYDTNVGLTAERYGLGSLRLRYDD